MPPQTTASRSHRRPHPHPGLRPAPDPAAKRHIAPLDGLRGLAVLGILLFHAGHFGGGFLGVDLFFVLSGFLITGLLLEEAAAGAGRVDLVAFWGRRARRLLPALAVTVAGTMLLVWAFGSPVQLRSARGDAPWVVANAANWHFIADQVGYWNSAGTRVFSHLWSIAVEEQFYLLWPPVLMCLAGGLRGRGPARSHRAVLAVAAAGALASLALMLVLTDPVDTTRVYEGTDTRAFSLLLGTAAATDPVRGLLARAGRRTADCLGGALAAGLGAYWSLADGQDSPSLFQGGLFLHALGAAVLIGLLAVHPAGAVGRVLGAAPLRAVGLVSYGLYLWHWPVFVLLSEERLGFGGWGRSAVVIGVCLAAAVLSKVLVEDPVRFRSRWATGRRGPAACAVVLLALAALWALVPEPVLGQGSVDVTRLTDAGSA